MSDGNGSSDPSPWNNTPPYSPMEYYGTTPESPIRNLTESPMDISEEENQWDVPNPMSEDALEYISAFEQLKTQPNSPEEQGTAGIGEVTPEELAPDDTDSDIPINEEPWYPESDLQGNPLPLPVKQRKKTVSEYYDEFRASPLYQMYELRGYQWTLRAFLKGLRPGLRRQVEMRMCWNIQDVLETAIQLERVGVRKHVSRWGPPLVRTKMIPKGRKRGETSSSRGERERNETGSEQPSAAEKP